MSGHRVLVVEDEPAAQEMICAILRSFGDSPRVASNVDEALAAIDEEEFCLFVLDQQLPVDANAKPAFIFGGERVVLAARRSDKRRTAEGEHVTPIIALTSYPGGALFAAGLFEKGINAFVEKPVCDNMELLAEKRRVTLANAGRADHAACAALARRVAAGAVGEGTTAYAVAVRIAIDGKVAKSGRTAISINGTSREMQDRNFVVLLRSIVARDRSLEAWSSRDVLGLGTSRNVLSRIRVDFRGLVPDGFEVIEGDRRGTFRLNPAIVIEGVEWGALAEHPDAAVVEVVRERGRRRGGRLAPCV